jgi:hypothetical protein
MFLDRHQILERETRRERVLESRRKESRLKSRVRAPQPQDRSNQHTPQDPINTAEEAYFRAVEEVNETNIL